jgi:transposase
MLACLDRRCRLDDAITKLAADREFTPVVHRLGCIRGVATTLTAFGLAAEIGDWHRLTGRSIGAYVGLVPSEYSSGESRSQGGVTKTGNGHVRRLLVEAGTTVTGTGPDPSFAAAGIWPRPRPEFGARPPTGVCTPVGARSTPAGSDR